MAMNPMQRKSRNSFLLGMFVTVLLTGTVIGFLIYQLGEVNKNSNYVQSAKVYVLKEGLKSGQIITKGMLQPLFVHPKSVPVNSDGLMSLLEKDYLVDQNGNRIYGDTTKGLYYEKKGNDGTKNKVYITKDTDGKYYAQDGSVKTAVEISGVPVIAKIDISPNTVITTDMVTGKDTAIARDLRLVEFNMLKLPAKLEKGNYIDIRFTLPSGQNYLVVAKKEVKSCDLNTVWLELSEDEILIMNNAIVESYIMKGSELGATTYIEPGLQTKPIPTYPVSDLVVKTMAVDPNILKEAKDAYNARVAQNDQNAQRQDVDRFISQSSAEKKENIEKGVEQSKITAAEQRLQYIDSLDTY